MVASHRFSGFLTVVWFPGLPPLLLEVQLAPGLSPPRLEVTVNVWGRAVEAGTSAPLGTKPTFHSPVASVEGSSLEVL